MTENSEPAYSLVITVDYEVSISGEFDVRRDMIKPTWKLLKVCEDYGAKITIMAEVAEIWAYEAEILSGSMKRLGYNPSLEIQNQLIEVVKRGHDVQLHLHPQWLGAKWTQDAWQLDYSKYRLPDLDYDELVNVFRCGKEYLENLLSCYCDDYSCIGFRAGNWITQPSGKYLRALYEAGLKSDTSIFKGAWVNTASVFMDYRSACSDVLPWVACWDDINRPSTKGGVIELPIYAEPVSLFGMLTMKRLKLLRNYVGEDRKIARAVRTSNPRVGNAGSALWNKISRVFSRYPKQLDFCKLTSREMVRMIENVHRQYSEEPIVDHVPIVMIGHSKEPISALDFSKFLEEVSRRFSDSLSFSTYRKFIQQYSQIAK